MQLRIEIDQILSIHLWKFDGLPDEVIDPLNNLLKLHSSDAILEAIQSLLPTYIAEEKIARECRGNSGYAGELHTATEMKIKYLHESIEYIQNNGLTQA